MSEDATYRVTLRQRGAIGIEIEIPIIVAEDTNVGFALAHVLAGARLIRLDRIVAQMVMELNDDSRLDLGGPDDHRGEAVDQLIHAAFEIEKLWADHDRKQKGGRS